VAARVERRCYVQYEVSCSESSDGVGSRFGILPELPGEEIQRAGQGASLKHGFVAYGDVDVTARVGIAIAVAREAVIMSRDSYNVRDKSGKVREKVYINSSGSKEHWKTYSDGTPRQGPYKEARDGSVYNKYGRQVGHTKAKIW